ncbi:Zinc finger isoform 1 [Schistosoma japonicum]|uniref:Zinc finger isoform 1 n=2 Tax=Schistosoma japonicum TaxID=6182 RepID=A0A4Z2CZ61_SCHJA|nr:Zinc finger isoform 1 [Schistosoma japonicum]
MNKFLSTSQIDWLLMDKPTVDPILLGFDKHNGNESQKYKLVSDTHVDFHGVEQSATNSCVNQSEVDEVSLADSECPESWESNFCISGVSVMTTSTPTKYSSDKIIEVPNSSQSTPVLVCTESDAFITMKCNELICHSYSVREQCEEGLQEIEGHITPEYSKSLASSLDPLVKPPSSTQDIPKHTPMSATLHHRFADTRPMNSPASFLSVLPDKSHGLPNLNSKVPSFESDSFALPIEHSSSLVSMNVPPVDPTKQCDISEVDFQGLEETKNIPSDTSPIYRRPGHFRGSGPSSPSAVHHCNLCGKQYRHVASLRNHMRKHTSGVLASKRYKCNHCVYSSQYHRNVIKHMEATHRNHETFSTDNTSYFSDRGSTPCSSIEPDDFKLGFINSRVRIPYTEPDPNAYNAVSRITDSKDFSALSHVEQSNRLQAPDLESRTVSRQISPNYNSRIMNKYHGDSVGDLVPMTISSDASRSYRCDISGCNQIFQSVRCLSNHMKDSHRDLRRFKCPLEGCSFGGLRRMHLKRHINEFHSDKKLSLHKILDQNRLNHELYNSFRPVTMYSRPESFPPNITKLPDSQSLKRQCFNSQISNYVPLDPSYTNEYPYHNPGCHGNDVYSFPVSGLPHLPSDFCVSEYADRASINHQDSISLEQKPYSFFSTSGHTNRLFENSARSNVPLFQDDQSLSVNKTSPTNHSDGFQVQSSYPFSVSNQSVYYHRCDLSTIDSDLQLPCDVMNNEPFHDQQRFSSQNTLYPNLKSCVSFNPVDSFTNRISEPDLVEQLLDSTNASNTVLDHILCEPVEANKDDEVKDESSTLPTLNSCQISPLSPKVLSNGVKNSVSCTNVPPDAFHSNNMLSETDAFFSDLQEILARDMPMLTSSTPKGLDSSEVVLVTVKEAIVEPKSPTVITGCKLTSTSSLPSTDSGHECWSSSSSCSVGPNNTSAWGQQEAVTPLKMSSPFPSSYPSNQPCSTNYSTPIIFDNQLTEHVINEQLPDYDSRDQPTLKCSNDLHSASATIGSMSVTPQISPAIGSYQSLHLKANRNIDLSNTSQLYHDHSNFPHDVNYVQDSHSVCSSENLHLQYSQDHCASNQTFPVYRSSDGPSVNQQSPIPFYTGRNSYVSNDFPSNQIMFDRQQNEIQQSCQYSFTSLSSLHSEQICHSSYIQSKYQSYKISEADMRLTSSFRNYPPRPQELAYWQPNTKFRTGLCEQMPINPISYRNVAVGARESYPFENTTPCSQNNSQVADYTLFHDSENRSTHVRTLDQLPVQDSGCPTPKYTNYPDINDNLNCDRMFQTTQQTVNKRWPSEQQRLFNLYSSYPSSNYTPNLQMTSPLYPVGQPSMHSISRSKPENPDSFVNSISRIQNHGPYFSNQTSSASQHFSNSQVRTNHCFSPHIHYAPSQSICRDISQSGSYSIGCGGDRRYSTSQSSSTMQPNIRHSSNMETVGNWSVNKNSPFSGNQQDTLLPHGNTNSSLVAHSIKTNSIDQRPNSRQHFIHNPQNSCYISNPVNHTGSLDNQSSCPFLLYPLVII